MISLSESPISILDLADMLPPLSEEELNEGRAWLTSTTEKFEANMARNAIIAAWEMGAIPAAKAFHELLEGRLLDMETLMFMLATHAKASAIIEG